jgi:hypothetical protein
MSEKEQITFFAKTNYRNQQVPFGIKPDDRRRHMYVIGKTGMGKTTLLENMAIQDIRNGNGVCFIDPHGDSIVKILDFVPPGRINDVVYFNPADLEHPIAFNILEAVESRYKHLVASGLMGVFTKIWASMWSSRMEYILNNTILALLDSPGNTMLGIVRMYVDKKYRKRIVDNTKDPMVRAFWIEEFANYAEKYRTEAVAPIQNKVGQFLSSAVIRNIVGQPKSTIDLRDIMDNRKILLLDLSKGKVGEDNSALLGAMIITKLQLAALSRVDIPENERKDFYLYVDEFQNFVTDSFATILSEARKYRLNLIMGHQYIGQLSPEGNNKVRDAVFGNVGTMVVFRVGAADAEFLETEFEPSFAPTDIVNLPKYHIILKLMINGVASDPFTAITMPVNEDFRVGDGDKVIKVSRERYANPREQVEDKIQRWMGTEFHEASAQSRSDEGGEKVVQGVDSSVEAVDNPELITEPAAANNPDQSNSTQPQIANADIQIAADFLERVKQSTSAKQASTAQEEPKFAPRNPNSQRPQQPRTQQNNFRKPRFDRPADRPKPNFSQNKPAARKPSKPQNDIWNTAQQISQDKQKSLVDNISQGIEQAFEKPQTVIPKPVSESNPVTTSVQPQESVTSKPKPAEPNQSLEPNKTYEL